MYTYITYFSPLFAKQVMISLKDEVAIYLASKRTYSIYLFLLLDWLIT